MLIFGLQRDKALVDEFRRFRIAKFSVRAVEDNRDDPLSVARRGERNRITGARVVTGLEPVTTSDTAQEVIVILHDNGAFGAFGAECSLAGGGITQDIRVFKQLAAQNREIARSCFIRQLAGSWRQTVDRME